MGSMKNIFLLFWFVNGPEYFCAIIDQFVPEYLMFIRLRGQDGQSHLHPGSQTEGQPEQNFLVATL